MRQQNVSKAARLIVHNAVLVQKKKERKMNAVEVRSLRRICGVSLADGIRNEEIRRMAGTSENVTVRMKKNMFRWFGHSATR